MNMFWKLLFADINANFKHYAKFKYSQHQHKTSPLKLLPFNMKTAVNA